MSLKCHFLKNLSTDFSEILVEDVKLMLVTVLKVSRRYLPPFVRYRENPAGGGQYLPPPPPVGRGLNLWNLARAMISDAR